MVACVCVCVQTVRSVSTAFLCYVYLVRNLSALFSESVCAYGLVSLCSGLTESNLRHSAELAECLVQDRYVAFMVHCLSCFLRLPLSDRMGFVHEQSPFSVLYR